MAVKPIKPTEVVKAKQTVFPDEVIEAFNELIVKDFRNGSAIVKQDEVTALICSKMNIHSQEVCDNHWLDVEDVFRKAGWRVEYDSPAYNESYPATFTFTKK